VIFFEAAEKNQPRRGKDAEKRQGEMKKVVEREQNKTYYRVLHLPLWIWVFFILPGHWTYTLYVQGPDRRHWIWLAAVGAICAWRGLLGRLPGVEPQPYITHYGADLPNLPYRVICYTAAWISILVPFLLNLIGLSVASITGWWALDRLYDRLYYPLALLVIIATALNWTPRARRSTHQEGAEKAWFYVAMWTVVPAQIAIWGVWRLGGSLGLSEVYLGRLRLAVFVTLAVLFFWLSLRGRLPRTQRYHPPRVS
jgi:hypothetical protein